MTMRLLRPLIVVDDYRPTVYWFARVCHRRLPQPAKNWIALDDLKQEGIITLLECAAKYQPHLAQFNTLLTSALQKRYCKVLRDQWAPAKRKAVAQISLDDPDQGPALHDSIHHNPWERTEIRSRLKDMQKHSDPEERAIIKFILDVGSGARCLRPCRAASECTHDDVADALGIPRYRVGRITKRMRKRMENL